MLILGWMIAGIFALLFIVTACDLDTKQRRLKERDEQLHELLTSGAIKTHGRIGSERDPMPRLPFPGDQ